MQAWLDAHPRRTVKGAKHDAADFGLSKEGLAARFEAYRTRRGYV